MVTADLGASRRCNRLLVPGSSFAAHVSSEADPYAAFCREKEREMSKDEIILLMAKTYLDERADQDRKEPTSKKHGRHGVSGGRTANWFQ